MTDVLIVLVVPCHRPLALVDAGHIQFQVLWLARCSTDDRQTDAGACVRFDSLPNFRHVLCGIAIASAATMTDPDCVACLQWALPRLGLRWQGYRRVRKQVCKRVDRRIAGLGLNGLAEYKSYLDEHADELAALEALCSIPISRFYRDRAVFDALGDVILPELAERAASRVPALVRCWSAGCASGEEPYTLSLLWDQRMRPGFAHTRFAIVATDVDEHLLARALAGCYSISSLRELPPAWIQLAFDRRDTLYCLRDQWKMCVEFRREDIRREQPPGEFDLVLCRNVAFTYFDAPAQRAVLAGIAGRLSANGFLVVGKHESLPADAPFQGAPNALGIFRKTK